MDACPRCGQPIGEAETFDPSVRRCADCERDYVRLAKPLEESARRRYRRGALVFDVLVASCLACGVVLLGAGALAAPRTPLAAVGAVTAVAAVVVRLLGWIVVAVALEVEAAAWLRRRRAALRARFLAETSPGGRGERGSDAAGRAPRLATARRRRRSTRRSRPRSRGA